MKKNLPNSKVNRWLVLGVVAVFSIAATFAVYNIVKDNNTQVVTETESEEVFVDNSEEPNAYVSTVSNYEEGYVELLLTTEAPVSLAEFVLAYNPGVEYVELVDNTLFADYVVSELEENVVRIGATGGPQAEVLQPVENATFAKVYFNNLTEGSVYLDTEDMTVIDDATNSVNVIVN